MADKAPPFSIGAREWPGTAKVAEEAGEAVQALAILFGRTAVYRPDWDDTRLADELGDLWGAIMYCAEANGLTPQVRRRALDKFHLFQVWHHKERSKTHG